MVNKFGKMEASMMDNGKETKRMVMEN